MKTFKDLKKKYPHLEITQKPHSITFYDKQTMKILYISQPAERGITMSDMVREADQYFGTKI